MDSPLVNRFTFLKPTAKSLLPSTINGLSLKHIDTIDQLTSSLISIVSLDSYHTAVSSSVLSVRQVDVLVLPKLRRTPRTSAHAA